ncbi:hypothetical protein Esti_005724 [Eimeria stiedai]
MSAASTRRRRARALRLLYPISTPFTSLRDPAVSETIDLRRDTCSECYCLSSSLQHLRCTPNSWIWVSPAGAPLGAPLRLLRLLALPTKTDEGGPPGGPPCHCWMKALAVPPQKRSNSKKSSCEGEEAEDAEVSEHLRAAEGPSAVPPPLFLPSHVLSTLGLAPGQDVEVWGAFLDSGGSPQQLNGKVLAQQRRRKEVSPRGAARFSSSCGVCLRSDPTDPVPSAFRCLPLAARCQVQQLSPPQADSWGPLGGPQGPPPTLEEADELLNDYFCVPRLVFAGDIFGILKKPFRYGAPCCGAPCNGSPLGAPHEGAKGAPRGCPCCVSLHEIEHAEAFGVGPSRCEHLASRVLFKGGSNHPWGPLFCEGPSKPAEGGPHAAAPQGSGASSSANSAGGGALVPGKAGMVEAEVEAPSVLRRGGPSASCMGGGPCCHWSFEDGVYGCGHVEDLSKVAVLFRVTALEGAPSQGAPGAPKHSKGAPGGEPFGLVYKGSTELMLQEAPGWGPSLPFGIHFFLRTPPLPLLPSLRTPFSRWVSLQESLQGAAPSCCSCTSVSVSAPLSPLSCGGSFLVKRLCSVLGLPLALVNCNALAPPAAEAAAAKGIVHSDGSTAPGGNSLFSATLVDRASGGAPCLILLQHLEALMQDPGAPASRLERLDSLLAAHLRWFLDEHQQGSPLGSPPSRGPVLVVGTCRSEGGGKAEGLGIELRSVFEVAVSIPRPDEETRKEVFRRLTKTSGALCFAVKASSRRAGEEFAELTSGLSVAEARRFFSQLVETAAEAAYASGAQAQTTWDGTSVLSEALQLPPKGLQLPVSLGVCVCGHADPNAGGSNIPEVKWESVGGMEEAKEQIRQLITLPLQHPKLFTSAGSRGGCLLFGPPGTGKTLLAKAIATECDVNFIAVKGPELLNKHVYIGESEKNIRDLFARAKACQPCVLFFDEIDALLPRRGRASDSGGVLDRVVAQVLSEMDDLPPRVFPIGATNRIELLDGAALRAGRLDRRVYLGVQQDKGPLLKAQTGPLVVRRGAPLSLRSLAAAQPEAEEVVAGISRQVPPGATGADCRALCNTACLLATKERIQFARSLETALSLTPTALQEAAVEGWSLLDADAPSLGCTYRVSLHKDGEGPPGGPQVTLTLMANQTLRDNAEGLQVWRGCLGVTGAAQETRATPPDTTFWVVSVLPAADATRCLDAITLELLLPPNTMQKRSPEKAPEACPALLNQHLAAVWMAGAPRDAEGPPLSPLLEQLYAYQGPPPCFAFAVHVLERHFIEALKELRPSVSAEDLRKYELLRDQYAVGAPLWAAETAAPIRRS